MIISNEPSYSVLMSVYFKEKPEYLRDSIDSMLYQTVSPAEFVLVCDGPLTPDLDAVIAQYLNSESGRLFKVIRLECNSGLGAALNIGLNECNSQFIARMDSDDISLLDRCEKELAILSTGEIDFVSGTVLEFCDSPSNVFSCRKLPEDTESILEFAKKRNPINHPAVMFKKDAVLSSGGSQPFYLLEDYFLWIRMLSNGFRAQNISDSLVYMRADEGLYSRRGGFKYASSQIKLLKYMYQNQFISINEFVILAILRAGVSLVPTTLRKMMYSKFVRSAEYND